MDRETITTLIMFGAVVGLVMSGYYMRKVMEEIERKENIPRMSREWVMRNHPTNKLVCFDCNNDRTVDGHIDEIDNEYFCSHCWEIRIRTVKYDRPALPKGETK